MESEDRKRIRELAEGLAKLLCRVEAVTFEIAPRGTYQADIALTISSPRVTEARFVHRVDPQDEEAVALGLDAVFAAAVDHAVER